MKPISVTRRSLLSNTPGKACLGRERPSPTKPNVRECYTKSKKQPELQLPPPSALEGQLPPRTQNRITKRSQSVLCFQ